MKSKYTVCQKVWTTRPLKVEIIGVPGSIFIPKNTKAEICCLTQRANGEIKGVGLKFLIQPQTPRDMQDSLSRVEIEVMPEDIRSNLARRIKAELFG